MASILNYKTKKPEEEKKAVEQAKTVIGKQSLLNGIISNQLPTQSPVGSYGQAQQSGFSKTN